MKLTQEEYNKFCEILKWIQEDSVARIEKEKKPKTISFAGFEIDGDQIIANIDLSYCGCCQDGEAVWYGEWDFGIEDEE